MENAAPPPEPNDTACGDGRREAPWACGVCFSPKTPAQSSNFKPRHSRPRPPIPGPLMSSTLTPSTSRATFAIGDEQTARRVVDLLTESFFEGHAVIAAFEGPSGRGEVSLHFAQA